MAYNGNAIPQAITNGLRRQQMGEAGGYGSIASRSAPVYGSIAARANPGAFGGMPVGNAPNPDEVAQQNNIMQQNQRTLGLRQQNFELANPIAAQQIFQNNQRMSLYRQNMFLNAPNLGLNGDDDEQQPQ